jgi:hypothetical protein
MTEYVPSDEDLEVALSGRRTIDERIAYVKSLFDPLKDHARMRANYEAEIAELQESRDGMREELRNLRIKLGDLSTGDRAALEQRYDMLGKIKAARGMVPALRVEANKVFDRLEEALKE